MIRLPPKKFIKLKQYILERDGWCLAEGCGSPHNLTAHHVVFVSQGGEDVKHNLVCMCIYCHTALHDNGLELPDKVFEMLERER